MSSSASARRYDPGGRGVAVNTFSINAATSGGDFSDSQAQLPGQGNSGKKMAELARGRRTYGSTQESTGPDLEYAPLSSANGYGGRKQLPQPGSGAQPNLAFADVSYVIPPAFFSFKKKGKIILDSVSGLMFPGLNAILGPTGSGKTTLLDILANRKASSRVRGAVLFNSERIKSDFRFSTGYVIQDDIVTGTLTVRENLHFSAALRLPSSMSRQQKKARVDKVISQLNLNGCADQKIGTEFIRGVSGGERKRTNIGMELIIEPQILFLDEPTTGLDAHTAVSVIQLLKNLTKNGDRIVVMSIHQPRYSIYKLFDTLTLLSLGRLIYHGQATDALGYFSQLGFHCEEHDNPADFFLDLIDSCEKRDRRKDDPTQPLLGEDHKDTALALPSTDLDLGDSYLQSETYSSTQKCLQSMVQETEVSTGSESMLRVVGKSVCSNPYTTNVFWQFLVVVYRASLKMWRNPMTNVIQLIVMVVFGLLVGGIYFQRDDTPRGMQDRLGAFFFIILTEVFGGLGAIELFIKERASFLHETSSGYYRVSVYFVAKIITDLIILRTVPLSIFAVITYFMIGLQTDVGKFFLYYLTLCLTTIGGAAIAYAFSAMVSVFAVANLLVSLVFVFYMLFGGALIGLSSLPSWIQWMKYISLFRYAVEALAVSEIGGQVYTEVIKNGTVCPFQHVRNETTNITICVADGDTFLKYFQGYNINWPWWVDPLALLATGVLWLTLTYIILRLVKRYYDQYK